VSELKPHPLCIAKAYLVGKEITEALGRLDATFYFRLGEEERKRIFIIVKYRIEHLIEGLEELIEKGCFPEGLTEKVRSAVGLAKEALKLIDANPGEAYKKLSYAESILDDVTFTMYAY